MSSFHHICYCHPLIHFPLLLPLLLYLLTPFSPSAHCLLFVKFVIITYLCIINLFPTPQGLRSRRPSSSVPSSPSWRGGMLSHRPSPVQARQPHSPSQCCRSWTSMWGRHRFLPSHPPGSWPYRYRRWEVGLGVFGYSLLVLWFSISSFSGVSVQFLSLCGGVCFLGECNFF